MYAGEPMMSPVLVAPPAADFEIPKSSTFTIAEPSLSVQSIRSRRHASPPFTDLAAAVTAKNSSQYAGNTIDSPS